MTRPTALILRALGLGDFFTGLPALRLVRDALPEHRLVLALPRSLAPLARLSGFVDDVVHGHELDPLVDPPERPQIAIDLHGNGPASANLLARTNPVRIVAYANGVPRWRADEHEVARWCRLVIEGLPAPDARCPPVAGSFAAVPDVDVPAGRTLLHCGAKAPSRRWPADRFAEVAGKLRADGHDVLVLGGPPERALAEHIGRAARVPWRADLSVLELVATIARARLLISGDTGPAHVASNYQVPSVLLFGPVSPQRWGPPVDLRHRVLWHGDGTGDPHGTAPDPALLAITVDEVLATVRFLCEERRFRDQH